MSSEESLIDLNREVMSRVVSAVAVLTQIDGDGILQGMTITSLSSVSAEPPSVLMCVANTASSRPSLVEGQTFCVNILAADQVAQSVGFAWGDEDPFEVFEWSAEPDGTPVLAGTAAHLLCEVERVVEQHGTAVVFGRVTGAGVHKDEALSYWRRQYYGDLVPTDTEITGTW